MALPSNRNNEAAVCQIAMAGQQSVNRNVFVLAGGDPNLWIKAEFGLTAAGATCTCTSSRGDGLT